VLDDWHGNYDGDKVEVSLREIDTPFNNKFIRVVVSGNDDTLMIKDFIYFENTKSTTYSMAFNLYSQILAYDGKFTMDIAENLGLEFF
jgi:hypothetical protein